jgi:hypothetical protein
VTRSGASSKGRSTWQQDVSGVTRKGEPAIRIVLDITRLVEEGKLTAQEAERLQALARRETGSLAINVLMSFGVVAVAAGIIALEPGFATGAALGVAPVAIGIAVSFFAAEQSGLLGTATTIILSRFKCASFRESKIGNCQPCGALPGMPCSDQPVSLLAIGSKHRVHTEAADEIEPASKCAHRAPNNR